MFDRRGYNIKYRKEHKKEWRIYAKRYYQKHKREIKMRRDVRKQKAMDLVGSSCFFCRRESGHLDFHEKAGLSHDGNTVNLVLKNPELFVLLCYPCHKGVHWCMKLLKMSWSEIVEKFNA